MKKQQKKKEGWEVNEPRFNVLNYNESLLTNLNYYSVEVDSKIKQEWVIEYYKNEGLDITGLDKLNPMLFDQAGVLVRLISRGITLSPQNYSYLENKFGSLRESIPKVEKREKLPEKKTKEVIKNHNNADQFLSEIDVDIDLLIYSSSEVRPIRLKLLMAEMKLKTDDFIYIKDHITSEIKYYNEILADGGDLAEAYSHIPKKTIKRVIKFLEEVYEMSGVTKAERKRKSKEKLPAVLVKSFQFLNNDDSLKIKSITPEKIIGANEVWLFDTEKRKLIRYKANDGDNLTVKGTTILNWSFEKSSQKTVRKPEEIVEGIKNGSKSEINKIFSAIKAVDMEVKGRTNKNILILRSF